MSDEQTNENTNHSGGDEHRGDPVFFYTETPLHTGSGVDLGAVDLPIQRERLSGLPVVQGSGLKGAWREEATVIRDGFGSSQADEHREFQRLINVLFGPLPGDEQEQNTARENNAANPANNNNQDARQQQTWAGALTLTDASLLLLPVRTLRGGWAWCTSPMLLERVRRALELLGRGDAPAMVGPEKDGQALVARDCAVSLAEDLMLEDLQYAVKRPGSVASWAAWLAEHAVPRTEAFKPFGERLAGQLVVLSDGELRHFAQHATEVVTRTRIDSDTGTVKRGGLWTEESLPSESLLWSLALYSKDRRPKDVRQSDEKEHGFSGSREAVRDLFVNKLAARCTRIRLGGDRTVGRGIVGVRVDCAGQEVRS